MQRCFSGTATRIEGIGVKERAIESLMRHAMAYPREARAAPDLDVGGSYRWRRGASSTCGTRKPSRACSTPRA